MKELPASFVPLRARLLSFSSFLANLPTSELTKLECPSAKYLVGWSRGRETLRSGHFDTLKGSFYLNASSAGAPTDSEASSFPEYHHPNIWPPESLLPGFRETAEALLTFIISTAVLVAGACDKYAERNIEDYRPGCLERIVRTSTTTKARLLHYFPPPSHVSSSNPTANGESSAPALDNDGDDDDDWCATHLDHGCLTGLTSAMFVDETASPPILQCSPSTSATTSLPLLDELPRSPDPKAGLYIHSRSGATVHVKIPRDCLAFQTGEALQIITKGKFMAVPHFVRGGKAAEGRRVARNTLAVFTREFIPRMAFEGFES